MNLASNFLNNFLKKTDVRLLLFFLFLYQLIFIFWGIDFTDMGWMATNYQQVFNDPRSVEACFGRWLTIIIGGIWVHLFPGFGIIGIRVLGVLVYTATLNIVFLLLKDHFDRDKLKSGLVLMVLLTGPHYAFMGFHYNTLTAFFFVLMLFFLFRGLVEKNYKKIIIAGVFLGLNVFVRIPNIAGIAILAVIGYCGYHYKYTFKQFFKVFGCFLIGLSLATGAMIILMVSLNQEIIFLNSLKDLLNMGVSDKKPHGIMKMLRILSMQFLNIFSKALIIIIVSGIFIFISGWLKKKILFLIPLILAILIYFSVSTNDFMLIEEMFTIYGLILIVSIYSLWDKRLIFEQKLLIITGLAMFAILPLGSDLVLVNMNGLFLFVIFPIVVERILNFNLINGFSVTDEMASLYKKSLAIITIGIILFGTFYYTYCEQNGKNNLHFSLESSLAHGVFTSKERADDINELINESQNFIKKNDYVLAFDWMPMFHFLTETRPYLYNIGISHYSGEELSEYFEKSLDEKKILPVIIRQKIDMWGNWPRDTPKNYHEMENERNRWLNNLLLAHNYKMVWENNSFQILIP